MDEMPILFSGPLVRAILEGRKTQTRRLARRNLSGRVQLAGREWHPDDPDAVKASPYGAPGGKLWVRETHGFTRDEGHPDCVVYRATDDDVMRAELVGVTRWRPSIHMPRWASRITLNVTGVRLERLQEITTADISAEGMPVDYSVIERPDFLEFEQRQAFRDLWDGINGKRPGASWDSNPLVWKISFRRINAS